MKAHQIEVESVREIREGVFAGNFINDKGEERKDIVMFPREVMSETGDMVHRPHFVGKYLLATAMENEKFRDELLNGMAKREVELANIMSIIREKNQLEEVTDVSLDRDVLKASSNRIEEIEEEIGDKSAMDVQDEIRNLRQAATAIESDSINVEVDLVDLADIEEELIQIK
jgi:hypothetical protein